MERWREVVERTPEEIQAAVEKMIAEQDEKVAAAKERAHMRQAGTPEEVAERERARVEAAANRIGAHLGEMRRRR
jgi:predicted Co/Zn/Cd cation transporter (cation efflux family)